MIAEGIIFHVDTDKIVEPGGREAQNAGYFLGMEQVSSLVPVNPHATQVIAQKVVQRVTREEGQAVRDPVGLFRVVIVVGFGPLSQIPDGFGSLLVSPRPDAQANTVQGVRRVLLEDERMVSAVGLVPASTDFHVVRETSLFEPVLAESIGFTLGR